MPGVLVEVLSVPAEPVLGAALIHVRHVWPQHISPSGGVVRQGRRLPGASTPLAWNSAILAHPWPGTQPCMSWCKARGVRREWNQ